MQPSVYWITITGEHDFRHTLLKNYLGRGWSRLNLVLIIMSISVMKSMGCADTRDMGGGHFMSSVWPTCDMYVTEIT